MSVDAERVSDAIAELAETVIRPHHKALTPEKIRRKSSANDLVTDIDEEMEDALRATLSRLYPAAHFVGEESVARDPSVLDALEGEGAFWIVDPIDGTRSFVNGSDEFGVIVALVENGETVMGWIYGMADRATMTAERGAGVHWRGGALEALTAFAEREYERPRGMRSVGWLKEPWREAILDNLASDFDSAASRCSAYSYVKMARGEVDFRLSSSIHPWDHAAGALIVSELGGAVRWLDTGDPYRPQASAQRPLLASAAAEEWREFADQLLRGAPVAS